MPAHDPPPSTKPLLVVLTGAGMSKESGIPTFRDMDGLWHRHRIEDVATPEGWERNPALVLDFYNERRKHMWRCEPNEGHRGLARLQGRFDVRIVTQNVDNLHERAGSRHVLHLHGELGKARGTRPPFEVVEIGDREIHLGDQCPNGSQLRPHIVWFGEDVPLIRTAQPLVRRADIFVVIGTTLKVHPAAGLLDHVPPHVPIYLVDPETVHTTRAVRHLQCSATEGVLELEHLLAAA